VVIDDVRDAERELKRLRKEVERAKREAKHAVELSPEELAAALLPTSVATPKG
jgi:phage shock protein A